MAVIDPPATVVAKTIKKGAIYLVNQNDFTPQTPHFYVILNEDPINEIRVWLTVFATSKVESRERFRKINHWPRSTLVRVDHSRCPFLSKPSVFDCNGYKPFAPKDFLNQCNNSPNFKFLGYIDAVLIAELVSGVKASLIVAQDHKDMLSDE
jgi:hypothetical protein